MVRDPKSEEILDRLSDWINPDKLTLLDADKNSTKDWNNLWKVPKHKLVDLVHPDKEEGTQSC